jgi:hypothetical protein
MFAQIAIMSNFRVKNFGVAAKIIENLLSEPSQLTQEQL